MKRILLIVCVILLVITLTGCARVTDDYGIERSVSYGLVTIDKVSGDGYFEICYDPTTKICYMKITGYYRLAVSPYYIIGNDGKPEIAIYGVNYKP